MFWVSLQIKSKFESDEHKDYVSSNLSAIDELMKALELAEVSKLFCLRPCTHTQFKFKFKFNTCKGSKAPTLNVLIDRNTLSNDNLTEVHTRS